ncbi:hypothetical protein E4V51_33215, partial [Paenibacillus sp. 28ISP30-2]|nr:hypothetical protein [Paenibacillus sp. 28ISP30-2]
MIEEDIYIRWIFNKNGCGSQSYEAICPWFIADGSAAEKWNGSFHDAACCAHLEDEKRNELRIE